MNLGLSLGAVARRRSGAPGAAPDPAPASPLTAILADGWSATYPTPPASFTPDTAPQTVTISRQGFTTTAQATTISEPMPITARVRNAYPDHQTLTADRVSLGDYVYSTDTIVGVTNNSTEASPKPVANWAMLDRQLVGNTIRLEVVAFHRNARSLEEVACVEFRATDGTTTVTQIVSQSSILGHGEDRQPVIGYACDLDVSTLANPATITTDARVFPWVGGAASVRNSADETGAREFSPRIYRRDVARFNAPPLVYVNATTGNDTTGVVSTDAAVAAATPCLTIAGAINRLVAVTGVTGGTVDGCQVRCMAGTHAFGGTAATRPQTAARVTITRDPAATRDQVILNLGVTTRLRLAAGALHIEGVTLRRTAAVQFNGEAAPNNLTIQLENVILDNNGISAALVSSTAHWRAMGLTILSPTSQLLAPGASEIRMLRGVQCADLSGVNVEGWLILGSVLPRVPAMGTGARPLSGSIIAFNKLSTADNTAVLYSPGGSSDVTGIAFAQNTMEFLAATSASLLRLSGDAATGNTVHACFHHNTLAGTFNHGRSNLCYDDGSTPRTHRLHSFVGNIHVQINTKGDIFRAENEGDVAGAPTRLGHFPYLHGVGCDGEFSQFIDANSGGLGTKFAQTYPGARARIGTSSSARNDPLFLDFEATNGSTAGAGGGDYRVQAGSPAKGMARPVLRFDLAGQPRSATLATAGAYE